MDSALVDQTSDQFVGQWKHLVSTTNWEKGRIIQEWRASLVAREAPPSEYSDDAWSRRVGHVTPQHVGRLRRVFERFDATRHDYQDLYWSHFQAALDWSDAEMWLEGAVQSGWSVAEMRAQRSQTLGAVDEAAADSLADEPWDEDAASDDGADVVTGAMERVHALDEAEAYADEHDATDDADPGFDHEQFDGPADTAEAAAPAIRPFAELPPLPDDVNDAFEAYKLCILRHKLAGWVEISREDMLASLDSLRQLAQLPADA